MNLDLTPLEMVTLSAGLGLLGEAVVNPKMLDTLSGPGKASLLQLQANGQWPSMTEVEYLLNKLLAVLQVHVEAGA